MKKVFYRKGLEMTRIFFVLALCLSLSGLNAFASSHAEAPNNAFNDGVSANFEGFLTRFPYLQTPNAGNTPRPANSPAAQLRPSGEDEEVGSYINGFPDLQLNSNSKK